MECFANNDLIIVSPSWFWFSFCNLNYLVLFHLTIARWLTDKKHLDDFELILDNLALFVMQVGPQDGYIFWPTRPPGLPASDMDVRHCWEAGICLFGVWSVCRCCLTCVWSLNVVQSPHPYCSTSTKYMWCPPSKFIFPPTPFVPPSRKYVQCPPSQYTFFCVVFLPPINCSFLPLPHSALSWPLRKDENLARYSWQFPCEVTSFCWY